MTGADPTPRPPATSRSDKYAQDPRVAALVPVLMAWWGVPYQHRDGGDDANAARLLERLDASDLIVTTPRRLADAMKAEDDGDSHWEDPSAYLERAEALAARLREAQDGD